jgi:integrase
MATIKRPRHGACFRIVRGEYVDGIFHIDGRRAFRGLCRLAEIERGPSGRRRTERQIEIAIGELWEAKRAELEGRLGSPHDAGKPMAEAFAAWRAHTEARGRSPLTLVEIARTCRYYLELVGEHPVGDSSTWHADRFLEGLKGRGIAPASINAHLSRLATFWRYAAERDMLAALPRVTRVKAEHPPRRVPTPEQVAALLAHLERLVAGRRHGRERYHYELHLLLAKVLLGTGMRSGEALAIRRDQVDLGARAIRLLKTKTGEPRTIRLPQFLARDIAAHVKAHPFGQYLFAHPTRPDQPAWQSSAALTKAFTRHYEALGIQGLFKPLHGFRALFATAGLNNVGVDPLIMMAQIGHADIKTTRTYYVAGLADAQLRAVDAIEEAFLAPLLGRQGALAQSVLD